MAGHLDKHIGRSRVPLQVVTNVNLVRVIESNRIDRERTASERLITVDLKISFSVNRFIGSRARFRGIEKCSISQIRRNRNVTEKPVSRRQWADRRTIVPEVYTSRV